MSKKPWVYFFSHQIRSDLRIPPPPFLLDLVNLYSIPLHQIHPFAIRRAITIYIICSFYGIEDSLGLIRATHIIKRTSSVYTLSPKPGMGASFIAHSSIDTKFSENYLCVRLLSKKTTWHHAWGQCQSGQRVQDSTTESLTSQRLGWGGSRVAEIGAHKNGQESVYTCLPTPPTGWNI